MEPDRLMANLAISVQIEEYRDATEWETVPDQDDSPQPQTKAVLHADIQQADDMVSQGDFEGATEAFEYLLAQYRTQLAKEVDPNAQTVLRSKTMLLAARLRDVHERGAERAEAGP
jgi:hypothetical protein